MPDSSGSRGYEESPASSRPPVHDTGQKLRQHQNDTAYGSQQATAAYAAQLRPVADPNGVLPAYRFGFQDTGRLVVGFIMDGTPIANCYRVHLEKGFAPIVATACSHGSAAAIGATELNTYAPGTPVIVMVHDKNAMGYILGGIPSILDVGRRSYHDYISQAARKRVDELHKKHIKQKDGGQIVDHSVWRPIDSTMAAEWGAISTTGLGVTVDDFMVRLSVNEFCGVYGFYHDQLLRVAGTNMQVWTAGSERDAFMDQAECNDTVGYAPYPWEAMGVIIPGQPTVQEYDVKTYLCPKQKPYYAHWENKNEYQQPYHRSQIFYGYLGQGRRSTVTAPPPGVTRWTYKPGEGGEGEKPYESAPGNDYGELECESGADKEKDHDEKPCFGLHEDNVGLDGRRFIASAKGITIAKRLLLPMPQRIKRPDTPDGDTEKDYKFSGQYGAGPEHKITGDIQTTDSTWPNLQRAASLLDLHGYLFNYAGIHPFYWHAKDYKTWEQSELEPTTKTQINHRVPAFNTLTSSMFLKQPEPKKWKIDHRYGEQDYYEMESFITLLEDGGVVIGDGYGGEIRMTGGSVFISAPGDVWLKSGRHSTIWSGADCSIRAYNGIDMSTTKDSVRIKSEKHFMALAGNDGYEGGILLESRGRFGGYNFENCGDDVLFGGIVLHARESAIAAVGDSVYVGTKEDADDGKIILDAGKGRRDVVTSSNNVYHYVKAAIYHGFGTGRPDEKPEKSNYFAKNNTLVCGMFSAQKDIFASGNLLCNKNIISASKHILTRQAERRPQVAPIDAEGESLIGGVISEVTALVATVIPDAVKGNSQFNKITHFDALRIGDADVQEKLAFSFRTDEQYKVADFLLYEDRWQQLAELSGQTGKKWEETGVEAFSGCDMTYPFPGKKWLVDEQAYVMQEFNIAEFANGGIRDMDRGTAPGLNGAYSNPRFQDNNKTTLNNGYIIIGKGT